MPLVLFYPDNIVREQLNFIFTDGYGTVIPVANDFYPKATIGDLFSWQETGQYHFWRDLSDRYWDLSLDESSKELKDLLTTIQQEVKRLFIENGRGDLLPSFVNKPVIDPGLLWD